MQSISNEDNSPRFHRVRIKEPLWTNESCGDGERLVGQHFLEDYELAREKFVNAFIEATYPEPIGSGRLIRAVNDDLFASRIADLMAGSTKMLRLHRASIQLKDAVDKLANSWEVVLTDARRRLVEKFDDSRYPNSASDVVERLSVSLEVLTAKRISSLQVLQRYSRFWHEPSIFDAIQELHDSQSKKDG